MRTRLPLGALCVVLSACGGDGAADGSKPDAATPAKEGDEGGAIGAFTAYQRKSMAVEAQVNVRAIVNGLQMAFEEERMDPGSMQVVTHRLPASVPATPPADSCCTQPEGTCAPDPSQWEHPTWQAVMFSPSEPLRYSYAITVEGETVTVQASGDLDCNGTRSSYSMKGTVADDALTFAPEFEIDQPYE